VDLREFPHFRILNVQMLYKADEETCPSFITTLNIINVQISLIIEKEGFWGFGEIGRAHV